MSGELRLGRQVAGEARLLRGEARAGAEPGDRVPAPVASPAPASAAAPASADGVLHAQSSLAFPKPRSGYAWPVAGVTCAATVALGAWIIANDPGGSAWIATLMLPIVVSIAAVFLLPRIRARTDRAGRYSAVGTVVRTDRAGEVIGEDAQLRALVAVDIGGVPYLLATTQPRLAVAVGDSVRVSWSRERPESCYLHG